MNMAKDREFISGLRRKKTWPCWWNFPFVRGLSFPNCSYPMNTIQYLSWHILYMWPQKCLRHILNTPGIVFDPIKNTQPRRDSILLQLQFLQYIQSPYSWSFQLCIILHRRNPFLVCKLFLLATLTFPKLIASMKLHRQQQAVSPIPNELFVNSSLSFEQLLQILNPI